MSSSSICSAARTTASGTRLALGHAGDLLDHVVDRLEVLDVDRRDARRCRRRGVSWTSCHRLALRDPGTLVWASSSIESELRSAGEHARRRPSLRTSTRGSPACGAAPPQGRPPSRRCARVRGSRRNPRRRRCRARPGDAPRRASRRSSRRPGQRRGRPAACREDVWVLPPSPRSQSPLPESSRARLSSSRSTRGSPRNPRVRLLVCCSTRLRTRVALSPRSRATRATCWAAYSGLIWGSSPEPLASRASGATRSGCVPSAFTAAARRSLTCLTRSGLSRPRLLAPVASGS